MIEYSLFIGRWQPWHAGHRWLIDQSLNQGKNVCIAIQDRKTDNKNPFTAEEVRENIIKELKNLIHSKRVKVIIIPAIESINYGRDVGYEIKEFIPPKEINDISATNIRRELNLG